MKIGVYGLGRFGSFWAGQLALHGITAYGYSRSRREVPEGVIPADIEGLFECDIIFYCVSISSFESVIRDSVKYMRPGQVIMDTCSVKMHPAKVMGQYVPEGTWSIATHPMFGPDSAKNGVEGLPFVISRVSCPDDVYDDIMGILSSWNMKMLEMSPENHDREAAWSQGITHFVGRTLSELNLQPTELATLGYKRLMSIVEQTCNDPMQLFYDLQKYNPYARQMRMGLKGALEYMLQELASAERE